MRSWVFPDETHFTPGEGLTLGFAYFSVGLTVSVLHVSEGTTPLVMLATIFIVNSVTPTLAYAAVTTAGGSTVAGIFSGWLVSTRFGLFAAAIVPRLWTSPGKKALAAHVTFDPNVAMAMREQGDDSARRVFAASAFWMIVPYWIGGTIGIAIGAGLTDPGALGLDAVFPAVMLAIIWPQLKERDPITIALLAGVVSLLLVEITPGGMPVLAAASVALLARRGDHEC